MFKFTESRTNNQTNKKGNFPKKTEKIQLRRISRFKKKKQLH